MGQGNAKKVHGQSHMLGQVIESLILCDLDYCSTICIKNKPCKTSNSSKQESYTPASHGSQLNKLSPRCSVIPLIQRC